MIAVTFALPNESDDFVRLLSRSRTISRAGSEAIYGELHGQTVAVVHTGVGGNACRPTVEHFLARQPVDYLISGGFAGALDPELRVGDLLLGENFSSERLLGSPKLHLEKISIYLATLTSASTIISSDEDRLLLAKETGAAAVDMETAWIYEVCTGKSVPMISLRAISDTAAEPFPAPPHILFDLEAQRTPVGRLAFYLMKNPAAISALKDFAARISIARQALTLALSALIRSELA